MTLKKLSRDLAGEFGKTRNDTVRLIVREWMEKNTYLPVHMLHEDSDVDGCLIERRPHLASDWPLLRGLL